MTVQKRTHHKRAMMIQELLLALGCPKSRLYYSGYRLGRHTIGNFWTRPEGELLSLLEDSRMRYRKLMKNHHPDKYGSHEYAVELNRIWARIRLLFAKRKLTLP